MIGSHDDGCAVGGDDAPLAHAATIRDLNDRARAAMSFRHIMVTVGVRALGSQFVTALLGQIRRFDAFNTDNDPWGEHDFGSVAIGSEQTFWKIDYYNASLDAGSPNPADDSVTARVLTVMLASEY